MGILFIYFVSYACFKIDVLDPIFYQYTLKSLLKIFTSKWAIFTSLIHMQFEQLNATFMNFEKRLTFMAI